MATSILVLRPPKQFWLDHKRGRITLSVFMASTVLSNGIDVSGNNVTADGTGNPRLARASTAPSPHARDTGSRPEKSPSTGSNNWVTVTKPRHQQFMGRETRLLTFKDWPQAMPQKPEQLADAGFFYLGDCTYHDSGHE